MAKGKLIAGLIVLQYFSGLPYKNFDVIKIGVVDLQ